MFVFQFFIYDVIHVALAAHQHTFIHDMSSDTIMHSGFFAAHRQAYDFMVYYSINEEAYRIDSISLLFIEGATASSRKVRSWRPENLHAGTLGT